MRKKIAVLGSGVGSLTTAYFLAKSGKEFDITVYQMGWRCGGKGASGRNLDPELGNRIEEHGLHMWSGLYENAFCLMRNCFDALKYEKGLPLSTWREAFSAHSSIVLYEKWLGEYHPWSLVVPTNSQLPGESNPSLFLPLYDYVLMVVSFFVSSKKATPPGQNIPLQPSQKVSFLVCILTTILYPIYLFFFLFVSALKALGCLNLVLHISDFLLRFLIGLCWYFVKSNLGKTRVRRGWMILNFAYANFSGLVRCNVLKCGLDPLDEENYKDWIKRFMWPDFIEGESVTLNSPFTRFLYDAQFSYENGNLNMPNLGAGASLRTLLRMAFTFKGAVLWRMEGSMGEVVFVPLYQTLLKMGVKFSFFRQITRLECDPGFSTLQKIHGLTQAIVLQKELEPKEYNPLFTVKGIPAWPSEPFWDQLENGDILKKTAQFEDPKNKIGTPFVLERGVHFDEVVYGLPLDCIKTIGRELVEAKPKWKACLDHLKTVSTQAVQLWIREPKGFLETAGEGEALAVTYGLTPLNTMADMSFLIPKENWNYAQDTKKYPLSLFYLCGPLEATEETPFSDKRLVTNDLKELFKNKMGALMPGSTLPSHCVTAPFDEELLIDQKTTAHVASSRIYAQYLRQNTTPSERFTLTNVGSTKYRLSASDSGVGHMFLTGDWTYNTFNLANIEATVMSGMLCAHAICGFPKQSEIIGLGFGCAGATHR